MKLGISYFLDHMKHSYGTYRTSASYEKVQDCQTWPHDASHGAQHGSPHGAWYEKSDSEPPYVAPRGTPSVASYGAQFSTPVGAPDGNPHARPCANYTIY